jgi:hypothetical protein
MLRVIEHLAVYGVVVAVLWRLSLGRSEPMTLALAAPALLLLLLAQEIRWTAMAAQDRRDAQRARQVVADAERLRRRIYNLCAGLRLGFEICEGCWMWQPDRAAKELDRLRAEVGQFVSAELGATLAARDGSASGK